MTIIKWVKGRQVFDSRGNPTVEAEVILQACLFQLIFLTRLLILLMEPY